MNAELSSSRTNRASSRTRRASSRTRRGVALVATVAAALAVFNGCEGEDPGSFTISFGTAVLALAVFNIIAFTTGLWLFSRSLEYGRKMGVLSGY